MHSKAGVAGRPAAHHGAVNLMGAAGHFRDGGDDDMSETTRDVVMWGVKGYHEEDLAWSRDEAVSEYLDDVGLEEWNATVTVQGYARVQVSAAGLDPLGQLLDYLDDEYGSDYQPPTVPTEKMREAERRFIEAVVAEYVPWACEPVTEEQVVTAAWVREHADAWVQEPDVAARLAELEAGR